MAEFQDVARQRIKDLSSKDAATRRAAAYYMGEAGIDEAVPRLATLYKSDPDAGVRKAAAYSLGMFRAVEQALARGEEERVVQLLRQISEEGKPGKRLGVPTRRLVFFEIVLLLLLVILVAANVILPGRTNVTGNPDNPGNAAVIGDRAALVSTIRSAYTAISNDATTLTNQFQRVLTGQPLDCTAFFNGTQPIVLSAQAASANPDLAGAVDRLNEAQAGVATAYSRYEAACFEDQPLDMTQVGSVMGPLRTAIEPLPTVDAMLSTALITPTPAPTETPTPTVGPTATPTLVPTPTVSIVEVSLGEHLVPMTRIIETTLSNPRGPGRLLTRYWTDASQAGDSFGCREATPTIPADYVIPPDIAQAVPELAQAVTLINQGLSQLRQGWELFTSACASESLGAQAATGLELALGAEQAFRAADNMLAQLRGA